MAKSAFNAVTLEMLWTRLISITDEAAAALVRTSFSTVVREIQRFRLRADRRKWVVAGTGHR